MLGCFFVLMFVVFLICWCKLCMCWVICLRFLKRGWSWLIWRFIFLMRWIVLLCWWMRCFYVWWCFVMGCDLVIVMWKLFWFELSKCWSVFRFGLICCMICFFLEVFVMDILIVWLSCNFLFWIFFSVVMVFCRMKFVVSM